MRLQLSKKPQIQHSVTAFVTIFLLTVALRLDFFGAFLVFVRLVILAKKLSDDSPTRQKHIHRTHRGTRTPFPYACKLYAND